MPIQYTKEDIIGCYYLMTDVVKGCLSAVQQRWRFVFIVYLFLHIYLILTLCKSVLIIGISPQLQGEPISTQQHSILPHMLS